jgi:hypothetical protein
MGLMSGFDDIGKQDYRLQALHTGASRYPGSLRVKNGTWRLSGILVVQIDQERPGCL